MKFYISLILVVTKSVISNELVSPPEKGKAPALLFIKKFNGLFIPIDVENIKIRYETETLYGACPPTTPDDTSTVEEVNQQILQADENFYSCEEDYMPLENDEGQCYGGKGKMASFSYRVSDSTEEVEEKYRNLLVYATCLKFNTDLSAEQALYAVYRIIPYPPDSDLQETFDYDFENYFNNLPEDVTKPYCKDSQKRKLGEMFNGRILNKFKFSETEADNLIPQQLVPTFNLPDYYTKGITNHLYNYRPQWLSVAKDWDHINLFIRKLSEKVNLTIYAGTFSQIGHLKIVSKRNNTSLYIPPIWWILVKRTETKRGIVISLSNYPRNFKITDDKFIVSLCDNESKLADTIVADTCEYYGWASIRRPETAKFVHCCPVTKTLSKQLISEELELKVLSIAGWQELESIYSINVSPLVASSSSPISSPVSKGDGYFKRSRSSRPTSKSLIQKQESTRSVFSDSEVTYHV